MDGLNWNVTATPLPEELAAVDDGLDSHNQAAADPRAVQRLACFARTAEGTLIGGAVARTWGEGCELQQLWVRDDLRGQGLGSRLMQLVEEEARRRGCRQVFLETFNFQAHDFYRGLGYETVGEFVLVPGEVVKYIQRKWLL